MTIKALTLSEAIKVPPTPFPGLRPFEFHESDLFFGRDGQVEKLIIKLADARFVAVVGTSGSGKSSLVRAGLMPALVSGMMESAGTRWRIAVTRPGNDPIGSLSLALNKPEVFGSDDPENAAIQVVVTEATLRRGSRGLVEAVRQNAMADKENLLVVVDQFEELFRFAREASRKTKDESERYQNDAAAFVKLLLEAKSQREVNIFVVLTMRSDFLGDCAQFWDLPEAINESQYLIPRLTRDQLREVITGPVALGGAEITPRLITQLLNDIGDKQDQLPVLQHLLMRVWDEWKEKRLEVEIKKGDARARRPHMEVHEAVGLDLCCYYAVGGMAEALSRHADEAFNELPDERHREVTEKMFKALTEKGPDNREIRRPIMLGEICATANATEAEVITVIEAFRHPQKSFLMPPAGVALNAESLIDISHESLIRGWERLEAWVEDEARSARIYRRLAETAELHREGHAGLWGDPDLQLALDWQEKNGPNLEWARRYHPQFETAMAFLDASEQKRAKDLAESERQQLAEIARAKRELEQAQALAEAQERRAEAERLKAEEQQQRLIQQAKATSRLRRLLGVLGVVALLALGSTVAALTAYRRAQAASVEAAAQKSIAIKEKENAEKAARHAEEQQWFALRASEEAKNQKSIAVSEKENAVKAAREAEKQRQIALKAVKEAELQSLFALQETENAEKAALEAEKQKQKAEKSEQRFRQLNYVANMNLAEKAFAEGNRLRGYELLDGFLPNGTAPKVGDVRDFAWYRVWRLNHNETFTLKGHGGPVTEVAFSPDGKTMASVSADGSVKLWDVNTNQELRVLQGHGGPVTAVAFSPDRITLASGSDDETVKLWDLSTGLELRTINLENSVAALAFSPDGKTLACGTGDISVKLWDVSMNQLRELKGHLGPITAVAFSSDGKTLASGSGDTTVKLWDLRTQKELGTLKVHNRTVYGVAFSPDGEMLASASRDTTVILWDVSTKQDLSTLTGHKDSVSAVAFSPDGKTLASASDDRTVKLWNVHMRREMSTLKGHEGAVLHVAFSPGGRTLASAGHDHTAKLWDMSTTLPLSPLKRHISKVADIAFSPDGKTFVTANRDSTVKLWDVSMKQLSELKGQLGPITAVAFSPDGKTLAGAGNDKMVTLWDVSTQQHLTTLKGHGSPVTAVAFSPDGKTLASASRDTTVIMWDLGTKQELSKLKGHKESVTAVAFSPDGKTLASAGDDNAVILWDVSTNQELGKLKHSDALSAVVFSPDGKTLACATRETTVKLWDVETKQELSPFKGHLGSVSAVAFSPDGKTLASASWDSAVKLWDVSTRQELSTLQHEGVVLDVAFSPDGKTLATTGDNNVRLWLAATDREVAAQRNR